MRKTLPQWRFVCSSVSVFPNRHHSRVGWNPPMGFVTALTALNKNPGSEMDVPNYTVPPPGMGLQVCVCVCTALCVLYVCADIENFISTAVNAFLPLAPLNLISLFASHPSLLSSSLMQFVILPRTKRNLSCSTSVSQRRDLPIFSLLFC